MLRKKGQEIDLGAIAKGFAADEVKKIFESHVIKNGMELLKAGNIEAVFVTDEGNIYATHGLKNNLILQESES